MKVRTRRPGLNAALANELGKLIAEFTGRGATRSRAIVHHDLVVCLLEDSATRAERNLVAVGKAELVRHQRDALQHAMASQLIAAVEGQHGAAAIIGPGGGSNLGRFGGPASGKLSPAARPDGH